MRLTALALVMMLAAVLGCTRIDLVLTPTLTTAPSSTASTAPSGSAVSVEETPTSTASATPSGLAVSIEEIPTATAMPTPPVPMRIGELAWIADGIEDHEGEPYRAVRNLAELDGVEPLLLEKTWLYYSVEGLEIQTLMLLNDIALLYGATAADIISRILQLPVLNAVYEDDVLALEFVLQAAIDDPDATRDVILGADFTARTDEELRLLPLAFLDTVAVDMIGGLEWFRDGVARVEARLVRDLALIRLHSPTVFDELAARPWMNRLTPLISEIVGYVASIATGSDRDSESALAIARMRFLDGDKEQAAEILEQLAYIHQRVPGNLAPTLAHPRVRNEVSYSTLGTAVLASLEFESPSLAAYLWELPWTIDNVTGLEREVLRTLDNLRIESQLIEVALIESRWVENGIQEEDAYFIWMLAEAQREQYDLLPKILFRPWLTGNATGRMSDVVHWIGNVNKWDPHAADLIVDLAAAVHDPDVAREVIADLGVVEWRAIEDLEYLIGLPWVADGLVAGESRGMRNLAFIQLNAPHSFHETLTIPWIQDGTNEWEAYGLWDLYLFAVFSQDSDMQPNEAGYDAYAELITRRWVRDGLNVTEINTITSLHTLALESGEQGGDVLNRLIRMPFLSQISGVEQNIVESITEQMMDDRQFVVDILLDIDNGLLIHDYFDPATLRTFERG